MKSKIVEQIGEELNSFIGKKVFNLQEFSTDNNKKDNKADIKLESKDVEITFTHSTTW